MSIMKAIVLTCDRYAPFRDHMLITYQRLWPNHPFQFVIPYQTYPTELAEKYGERVDLVQSPPGIKETVLTLLSALDPDEWVYWCIDDKYLVSLKDGVASDVAEWIPTITDPSVAGVCFAREGKLHMRDNLILNDIIEDSLGHVFIRRRNYAQIWLHQFLRVKVLRTIFVRFPDRPFVAKEMDAMKKLQSLPDDHRLYVMSANQVVFGESTHRGRITLNCLKNMKNLGLPIPRDFQISDKSIIIGDLDNIRYPSFEFSLRQLRQRLTKHIWPTFPK